MTRWLILSLALTCTAAGASLFLWVERDRYLPEKVVTHWGWQGEPNGFTPRENMLPHLFIMPAVMAGLVLLTPILPWLSPQSFKVDVFRPVYDRVMALVVCLFGYMHALI